MKVNNTESYGLVKTTSFNMFHCQWFWVHVRATVFWHFLQSLFHLNSLLLLSKLSSSFLAPSDLFPLVGVWSDYYSQIDPLLYRDINIITPIKNCKWCIALDALILVLSTSKAPVLMVIYTVPSRVRSIKIWMTVYVIANKICMQQTQWRK